MPRRQTERAVADVAPLETARRAAGARGAGSQDPLVGELRRAGLLPLLVLHFLAREPSYGNQLMEHVAELTGGLIAVNPNTMYPLLRQLEQQGLVRGEMGAPRAPLAALLPAHDGGRGRARPPGRRPRAAPGRDRGRHRPHPPRAPRLVGRVSARIDVPGQASDAEALWYDHRRWPAFLDGLQYVARVEGDWPAVGALVIWDSFPGGRGRVLEEVTGYEARVGQSLAIEDETIRGTQRVAFAPARGGRDRVARARVRAQAAPREVRRLRPVLRPPAAARVAPADAAALRPRAAGRARSRHMKRPPRNPCARLAAPASTSRTHGVPRQPLACRAPRPKERSPENVRLQGRRRRRRNHGRPDRPDHRLGRHPGRAQGRRRRPRRGRADRGPEGHGEPGRQARRARQARRGGRPARRSTRSSAASPGRRPTTASATSTSSSRPCPSGWRSSTRCSPSSTRSRRATRSSPRTPRRCRSPRSATRPAPRQGLRLPLLLPGVGHAPGRDRRGRRHRRRDDDAAVDFAQAIRKLPITCAEVPGFVVNRILNSALSELWRMQEEQGLSIKQIDEAVTGSKTAPMGPFQLADLLGLDTILHVAEYLDASYRAACTSTRACAGWSPTASSGRRPAARASTPTARPTCPATAIPTRRSSPTASTSRRSSRPACSSRRASSPPRTPTSG